MSIKFQYNEDPQTGEPRENSMEIDGKLKDADGATIGTYTRTIDFVENKAESDFFKLYNAQQGKNLGKQMLAANVATYQKMGLDHVDVHADIDVGGYAWAKYGYVPNDDSWYGLQGELRDKLGSGGGEGYTPESWDEMTSEEQDNVYEKWRDETQSEFYDSEVENWRDSGGALEQAKVKLAEEWNGPRVTAPQWAANALSKWRDGLAEGTTAPFTNEEILAAVTVDEYSSRNGDGKSDPDITIDLDKLPEEMHDDIVAELVDAFNDRAERNQPDMEPPEHLSESVGELQSEVWDSMRDRDKYRWADEHGELPTREGEGEIDADESDKESLRALIDDDDPKAIWAIADSKLGKELLLGTDWNGTLNLHDPDTMARFNAYVGNKPKAQASAQAA